MGRISMPQGKGSLMHNRRDYEKIGREIPDNIDQTKTNENIILVDKDVKEAYQEIFGQALEQYNAKQKRKDRKIKDYCDHIQKSKNGEKTFYEDVIQWGSKEDFEGHPELRDVAKQCLIEYVDSFEHENPCLHVIGAYIHMDEVSPHLHLDFVPEATGYKNGLSKRNSLDKAMKQMGFVPNGKEGKRNNATMLWKEKERNRFKEICQSHGLEVEEEKQWNRKNLSVDEYKEAKEKMNGDLLEEHNQLIISNDKMAEMVDENTDKIFESLEKLDELKKQTIELTEKNRDLKDENKKLHNYTEQKLSDLIRQKENQLESLQNECDDKNLELTFLESRVFELEAKQNTLSELDKSILSLESKKDELKHENEILSDNNASMALEIETRRNTLSELDKSVLSLENKKDELKHENEILSDANASMALEIEAIGKKRVWKDFKNMSSDERRHHFKTNTMIAIYKDGREEKRHDWDSRIDRGMKNGTIKMGVWMPEEMIAVPKSVVHELIEKKDPSRELTTDTKLFVNAFEKIKTALSHLRKRDEIER